MARQLFRFRVHLIITAGELVRPVSFRTDVILDRDDADQAFALAEQTALDQDPLTAVKVISTSAERSLLES